MQEQSKFNFKINVIPIWKKWKKYMSFNINNQLNFIDSFQFLRYSLDCLVKILGKVHFNYLSQEFDSAVF